MTDADAKSSEAIQIKIRDQNGADVHFKVKLTTKLTKVFAAYAERKGISEGAIRFLFDGDRVRGEQTVKEIEIADGDLIDAQLMQEGGSWR